MVKVNNILMPLKFLLLIFQFLILIIVNETKVSTTSLTITTFFLERVHIRRSPSKNSLPLSIVQLSRPRSASFNYILFSCNLFWIHISGNWLECDVSQNKCIPVSFALRWLGIVDLTCTQSIELHALEIIYCLFLRHTYFDGSLNRTEFNMGL